jgi:hypothetical protein
MHGNGSPNYVPEITGGGRDRVVGFLRSLWDGGAGETLGERGVSGAGDGDRSKRTLGAYVLDLFLVLF